MELGQLIHGNPAGDYEMKEWQTALVMYLLDEIDRVYWNREQREWLRDQIDWTGLHFRPYYWGDDETEAQKPNLVFDTTVEQEIRWYKHPGRGMTAQYHLTPEGWIAWFTDALTIIRSHDVD